MGTRCDNYELELYDYCNNHRTVSANKANIEFWKCPAHQIGSVDTYTSPCDTHCTNHSTSACKTNNWSDTEYWTEIQSSCANYSDLCPENTSGAILPNKVTANTVVVYDTLNKLYDSIKAAVDRKTAHNKYKNASPSILSKPGLTSTIKQYILKSLNAAMQAVDNDVITIPNLPTRMTTGGIITATDMNNLIDTTTTLLQDCVCYSDCNGYSVCYCFGNCNHY